MKLRLEDRCQLKTFIGKMIPPIDEKYKMCESCTGYETSKFCYVKPAKKYEVK